ncbi:MAG: DMT family transporter [Nitrospirota bacterium]
MKDSNKAVIYALVACTVWGTVYVAVKIGLNSGLKPLTFAGVRFFASGLVLLILAAFMGRLKLSLRDLWVIALFGIFQTGVQNALFFMGEEYTNASVSAIFINTAPFFVILAAPLFFNTSRLSVPRVVGVLIGFGGVLITSWKYEALRGRYGLGVLLLILSAVTWAGSNIAAKKIMARRDTLTVTGMQMVMGGAPLIALGYKFEGKFMAGVQPSGWAAIGYLIVFATMIPFLAWYKALKLGEVGKVSVFGFTLPILGVLTGWLILGEPVGARIIVGMTMVAFGIITVNI